MDSSDLRAQFQAARVQRDPFPPSQPSLSQSKFEIERQRAEQRARHSGVQRTSSADDALVLSFESLLRQQTDNLVEQQVEASRFLVEQMRQMAAEFQATAQGEDGSDPSAFSSALTEFQGLLNQQAEVNASLAEQVQQVREAFAEFRTAAESADEDSEDDRSSVADTLTQIESLLDQQSRDHTDLVRNVEESLSDVKDRLADVQSAASTPQDGPDVVAALAEFKQISEKHGAEQAATARKIDNVAKDVKRLSDAVNSLSGTMDDLTKSPNDPTGKKTHDEMAQAALNGAITVQKQAEKETMKVIEETKKEAMDKLNEVTKKALGVMEAATEKHQEEINKLARQTLPEKALHYAAWFTIVLALIVLSHWLWPY